MKTIKYIVAILFVCLVANGCGNNPKQSEIDSKVTNFYEKQDRKKKVFADNYYEKAKTFAINFCKNKGYTVTKIDNSGFPPNCINEKSGSFSFNVRTSDISSSGGLITISVIVEVSNGSMSIYHFQAYS